MAKVNPNYRGSRGDGRPLGPTRGWVDMRACWTADVRSRRRGKGMLCDFQTSAVRDRESEGDLEGAGNLHCCLSMADAYEPWRCELAREIIQ